MSYLSILQQRNASVSDSHNFANSSQSQLDSDLVRSTTLPPPQSFEQQENYSINNSSMDLSQTSYEPLCFDQPKTGLILQDFAISNTQQSESLKQVQILNNNLSDPEECIGCKQSLRYGQKVEHNQLTFHGVYSEQEIEKTIQQMPKGATIIYDAEPNKDYFIILGRKMTQKQQNYIKKYFERVVQQLQKKWDIQIQYQISFVPLLNTQTNTYMKGRYCTRFKMNGVIDSSQNDNSAHHKCSKVYQVFQEVDPQTLPQTRNLLEYLQFNYSNLYYCQLQDTKAYQKLTKILRDTAITKDTNHEWQMVGQPNMAIICSNMSPQQLMNQIKSAPQLGHQLKLKQQVIVERLRIQFHQPKTYKQQGKYFHQLSHTHRVKFPHQSFEVKRSTSQKNCVFLTGSSKSSTLFLFYLLRNRPKNEVSVTFVNPGNQKGTCLHDSFHPILTESNSPFPYPLVYDSVHGDPILQIRHQEKESSDFSSFRQEQMEIYCRQQDPEFNSFHESMRENYIAQLSPSLDSSTDASR